MEPLLLWCRKLSIFAFSHNFIWILQESHRCSSSSASSLVVEEIYTSVVCVCFGDIWAYNVSFFSLSLLTVVFLLLWFINFFLTYFKATTSYGLFSLCYLWYFRPLVNQMFVIKFSVAFATVAKRTRPSYVFIEVFARQKILKRATGQLSPFSDNGRHTLLEIFVVMMENLYLCSFNAEQVWCLDLYVFVTVFVLFFFSTSA